MKKLAYVLLVICCFFALTNCGLFNYVLESDSLIMYSVRLRRGFTGNSHVSIDNPEWWLPSWSFLDDYEYLNGGYYWRESSALNHEKTPDIAILYLNYEKDVYLLAKQEMLDNIYPYDDKLYYYNDYIFYENSNFITERYGGRAFPVSFSMACYNDTKYTLIFLSLYDATIKEKYPTGIENNWKAFIEEYYGEHYDFSK